MRASHFIFALALILHAHVGADDSQPFGRLMRITAHDCRLDFAERTVLSAQRFGTIDFVVEEGQVFQEGDILIQLNDEAALASVELAELRANGGGIAVDIARKTAEAARFEYDIAVEADANATEGAAPPVSRAELNRLILAFEKAELEVVAAECELEARRLAVAQANAELNAYRVVSSTTGFVEHVYHRPGETVQQGEPLLEIVQPGTLRVEGRIALADAQFVKPGAPARLTIGPFNEDDPPAPIQCVIEFVDNSVIPDSQEVRVWTEIPDAGIWKAGTACEMEILVSVSDDSSTNE